MDKVTIKGKEYAVGGSLRAMMIWEGAMERPFPVMLTMVNDRLLYFYALLMAGAGDSIELGYDEFIDAMDSDPAVSAQFAAITERRAKASALFKGEADGPEDKKKGRGPRKSTPR